jgi:hypothetical protein
MKTLVRTKIHVNARQWSPPYGSVADRAVDGGDQLSRPTADSLYSPTRADLFTDVC